MINWHRLFGLALNDMFTGSPWIVELEKDLSLKQQFLDIVILRRGPGDFPGRLPDGLEVLADYNLLSYKSLHEPLDDWSLKELTGHFVNYRKQIADQDGGMPSEDSFQMFGVSTRFPEKLARQVSLQRRMQGVYETERGTDKIRVIVLNEMTRLEHNSLWHLFSCVPATVQFGASHHSLKTTDTSTILVRLFENYQFEGIMMPYTIQDFRRDFTLEHIHLLLCVGAKVD